MTLRKIINRLFFHVVLGSTVLATMSANSADHIDSPDFPNTSNISGFFAFESPRNPSNFTFIATLQPDFMDPVITSDVGFDENVLVEFNIDNTGDNIEDLVIQAFFLDGKVTTFGAVRPSKTGLISEIEVVRRQKVLAKITPYGRAPIVGKANGVKVFAGATDDPFFFDFFAFLGIITGEATAFNNPGVDAFAGLNALAVAIEIPKSHVVASTPILNTWVETKRKFGNGRLFAQEDQAGRPVINPIFIGNPALFGEFNTTIPSEQPSAFTSVVLSSVTTLNPNFTVNTQGLNAETFASVQALDVLNLSAVGATSFATSTGRRLTDDVIDTTFSLIFGGPEGIDNPMLTSDNVDINDSPFYNTFPFLASPW